MKGIIVAGQKSLQPEEKKRLIEFAAEQGAKLYYEQEPVLGKYDIEFVTDLTEDQISKLEYDMQNFIGDEKLQIFTLPEE